MEPPTNSSESQSSQPAQQSKRELDRFELEQLADRIIDLMKREVILSIEREGKLS